MNSNPDNENSTPRLAEKVVVITGGSRGIGFAAAKGLGALGATVVLVGQNPENLKSAVTALVDLGADADSICVDVSNAENVAKKISEHSLAPHADILINSAGVMSEKMAKTLRTSSQEWHRVMGTNLDGTFNMISAIGPQMAGRKSGRIINVSACLGRFSGPGLAGGLAPYRISKTAVNALTKNLAAELGNGSRGVLVDAMCPNHTRTDMGGPEAPRSPEEAADTILWLATREHNSETETGLLWEDRTIVPW
ncbi:MAG: SDR family NAD(P)-dependent oxidoreductase [Actinobacteria bacterium]|nr:SDR family NAD(P)-dependent oxidoreductase [Actinomycetota bacterium]